MILSNREIEEFKEASKPLIKLLSEKYNPHVTVIVTQTEAEIVEGSARISCEEFIKN